MAILDDVKILVGLDLFDISRDDILNIYIRRGVTLITKYLRRTATEDVTVLYPDALIEYVVQVYRKKGNEGLKSFGQGSRLGSYGEELSDSVKSLLPKPSIRMR
ncbi:MAG TPA: hypothetical protein DEF42_17100 [Desulfosporosinus sp.]|nr:hypothetical protein [Desulfosporosinus sp.]